VTAQQGIKADNWTVAGRSFTSRLIVGTGKYKSLEENAAAVEAGRLAYLSGRMQMRRYADPSSPLAGLI
jgi:thiazole synthase